MDIRVILMLAAVGVFALALLYKEGLLKKPAPIVIAVMLTALALVLRALVFGYETLDYQNFLTRWVDFFRQRGGWRALSEPVGNYNIPYLYFMALFSYSSVKDLYLIKLLSTVFDVLLAYSAMRLVSRWQKSAGLRLGCFFTVLLWPTVFLNSAVWAQCDSIYVALALLGIDLALDERPVLAMTCMALSFGFKLQAVFILPALGIALLMGKVKPRHLLWIPAVFFISLLPALFAGRSLASCLSIYADQTQEYGYLFHNAPTVWHFFESADFESFSVLTVFTAGAAVILFMFFCLTFIRKLKTQDLVRLFFLSAMLVPYVLPRMHERYFYMADVMALIYFMYDRRKWYIPAALVISSSVGYMYYFNEIVIINQKYIAVVFFIILATELREFFKEFWHKTPDTIPID